MLPPLTAAGDAAFSPGAADYKIRRHEYGQRQHAPYGIVVHAALGLDLKGGVYVEYEATMSDELREEGNNFDYLLQNTMDILAKRLTEKGYPEATVSKVGVSGIRVEIPDVTDPAAVLDLIGSPAKLEFLDSDGNVFMDGSALQTAYATKDENSKPAISFTLTKEGANIFGDMTAKSIGKAITIQLDGQELMSPTVMSGTGTPPRAAPASAPA